MERLTPGAFISTSEPESVRITKEISKQFIGTIYKLMLHKDKKILNLEKHYKGYHEDMGLIDVFIEHHKAWTKK